MAKKWIQAMHMKKGALHKQLHVPAGKKIPASKLAKAAHAGGTLGKRARLAQTLKGMHHHAHSSNADHHQGPATMKHRGGHNPQDHSHSIHVATARKHLHTKVAAGLKHVFGS